jgi:hypothetical protein
MITYIVCVFIRIYVINYSEANEAKVFPCPAFDCLHTYHLCADAGEYFL